MNGKGSKPRPLSVDRKTFGNNWELIFGNKSNESEKNKEDEDIRFPSTPSKNNIKSN